MPYDLEEIIKQRKKQDMQKIIIKMKKIIADKRNQKYPELIQRLNQYIAVLNSPNTPFEQKEEILIVIENMKLDVFFEDDNPNLELTGYHK